MSRVAIIIPCYNDGAFIEETLSSISEAEPLEIIIVDDGSTDTSTLSKLRELEENGIKVIHQNNQGLSKARMTGVKHTTAQYIFPLDSDDKLLPGVLEKMADSLDASPQSGFAYGNYKTFGDYQGLFVSLKRFDTWALTYFNFIPVSSLIRRTALIEVNGWDNDKEFEDWDLWMKMAENHWDGVYLPITVYQRRIHPNRMLDGARKNYRILYRHLKQKHSKLFDKSERRTLRHKANPSLRRRVIYWLIFDLLRNRNLFPLQLEKIILKRLEIRRLKKDIQKPLI